jgi:DNA-binding transcriptional ArsR family regulator
VAEATKELEQTYLRDVAALKAFAEPLRIQIILELRNEPKAVKEVASKLQVPPTRLYYHFKILEEAGLIRVADRRMVSGIEERLYEAIGESWQPAPEATASLVKEGIVRALMGLVRAELELALLADPDPRPGYADSTVPVLTLTEFALNHSQVEEVQSRINDLNQDFTLNKPKDPGQRTFRVLFAAYEPPSELASRSPEQGGPEVEGDSRAS